MKLTYETDTTEDSRPRVILSYDGKHLGTIWGILHHGKEDGFEQENGIVHVHQNGKTVAVLWNAQPEAENEQ